MPRSLIVAALFVASAWAGMLPDKLGSYDRQPAQIAPPQSNAQLSEYGMEAADSADYGQFTVTAIRFKDPTGAYAGSLATPGSIRIGNYVVTCKGKCPKDLAALAGSALPQVSQAATPTLGTYFPSKSLVPHSERYILGPASLAAVLPEVPSSAADFDYGTEAQVAQYRTASGDLTLGVFSYPTPSLARQQLPQFQKINGATAKRTGPLVAIAIGPADAAAKLLENVNYAGVVEQDQQPPPKPLEITPETAGQMILSIMTLAGVLLGFCLLSGLAVGGALRLARRFGYSAAEGSLITLRLERK